MVIQTQIYCRKPSLSEMEQLVALGATHVAWGVDPSSASELELSRQIVARMRHQRVGTVVLVCEPRTEALERVALDVAPDFLLVAAEHVGSGIDEQDLPGLAHRIRPKTALMMSVPVRVAGSRSDMGSVAAAERYQGFAGALILDTRLDPEDGAHCGCTGRTNDWEICADIVRRVRCPVVLAGGLSPENVAKAVGRVRPWGVDACSSLERPDRSKDLDACIAFVRAAAAAHAEQVAQSGLAEARAEP